MLADGTLLVIWAVLVIAMQIWLFKAAPPKEFIKKYSRTMLLLSIIPFMNSWRNSVEPGDMEIIERYRKEAIRYVFILIVSGTLVCTYLYLKHVSLNFRISGVTISKVGKTREMGPGDLENLTRRIRWETSHTLAGNVTLLALFLLISFAFIVLARGYLPARFGRPLLP